MRIEPATDALSTPVAWADADGQILGVNPAFARWLGVSTRRLLGQPLAALEIEGDAMARFLDNTDRDVLRLHRMALGMPGESPCFAEGWLSRLVAHATARPGAGLLGVELVSEEGEVDLASRRADPSLREQVASLGRRDALYLGHDPAQVVQPVDAVSGALMLMPLGLFVRLDGFDEGYRLHAEDLDLCRRVREAGYEVVVANDLRVTHVRGVSSRSIRSRITGRHGDRVR